MRLTDLAVKRVQLVCGETSVADTLIDNMLALDSNIRPTAAGALYALSATMDAHRRQRHRSNSGGSDDMTLVDD